MNHGKKPIAIFGAGGFGLEVAMLIEQINGMEHEWENIGFFDDGEPKGKIVNGLPVLGGVRELNAWKEKINIALALGIPETKKKAYSTIRNEKVIFPTLIHPSVIIGNEKFIDIGEGSIICAGNIITTNIRIGRHVILNLACTVGHETVIGDFSSFMPTCNISGGVTIGECSFWGTGAKVINHKKVGDGVTVGAGAVIINDVPDGVTVAGVPAKVIKSKNSRD